jgi:hypothetical protein
VLAGGDDSVLSQAGRLSFRARSPWASTERSFHFSQVSIRLAYSARAIGKPDEPKKTRSGGSFESTSFRMAGPVASGSRGTLFLRVAAIAARAPS